MSKTEVKEPRVVPKGTKTTEVILGTAAAKLGSGIKFMAEMIGEIGKLEVKVNENVLLIADQESKIAENALALKNSIAQNKIELQQAYETDREDFVNTWLQENDYEMINKDDLAELKLVAEEAAKNVEAEVKKQVAIVSSSLTSKHASEIKEKELQFKAEQANNVAQLVQKDEKIKFLEEQVKHWMNALDKEREASVQRAQAGTVQQTFTSGK